MMACCRPGDLVRIKPWSTLFKQVEPDGTYLVDGRVVLDRERLAVVIEAGSSHHALVLVPALSRVFYVYLARLVAA